MFWYDQTSLKVNNYYKFKQLVETHFKDCNLKVSVTDIDIITDWKAVSNNCIDDKLKNLH